MSVSWKLDNNEKLNQYPNILFPNLSSFPVVIQNWFPYKEGGEGPKKEADHYRVGGSWLNKQKNLHSSVDLGGHKVGRSPHDPARTLKLI